MAQNAYQKIMSGKNNSNIRFEELRYVLLSRGFRERIKGDHFIYKRSDIPERINLQPVGDKAKPYQVKQVRIIFGRYGL